MRQQPALLPPPPTQIFSVRPQFVSPSLPSSPLLSSPLLSPSSPRLAHHRLLSTSSPPQRCSNLLESNDTSSSASTPTLPTTHLFSIASNDASQTRLELFCAPTTSNNRPARSDSAVTRHLLSTFATGPFNSPPAAPRAPTSCLPSIKFVSGRRQAASRLVNSNFNLVSSFLPFTSINVPRAGLELGCRQANTAPSSSNRHAPLSASSPPTFSPLLRAAAPTFQIDARWEDVSMVYINVLRAGRSLGDFLSTGSGRRQANPTPPSSMRRTFVLPSMVSASRERRVAAHTLDALYRRPASGTHACSNRRTFAFTHFDAHAVHKRRAWSSNIHAALPPTVLTLYNDVPRAGRRLGSKLPAG
ncbi:hypothetical protein R3P38DRAFT_3165990 [Favolaschia claudopus]|uniref:Uncharacterized protein n=1 Tax=Favolaschia claudopus TaxID=2862362 RepID=A0AAW0EJK5_9AGAR